MINRNTIIIITIVSMFCAMFFSQLAIAQSKCAGVNTSIISCDGVADDDKAGNAIFAIIAQVIRIMTVGIGLAAAGSVIVGGILYSMSGDNPENVKKAKTIWFNTLIGLAMFAFFVALTNFLIPGGVF